MKKTLDGYRYDSENSEKLGETNSLGKTADSYSDFNYWEASLHRTPKKKYYFLCGTGGAMTRFGQSSGRNTWTSGTDLIPLTKDEAFKWAEEHLTADEVEKAFPDYIKEA